MNVVTAETNSPIVSAYRAKTTASRRLYGAARSLFPSGITHDNRFVTPHPIYVERAELGRKWDVDANEFVDYQGGHGALILGHRPPQVIEAVAEQLSRGLHYGAGHELEIRWGELVKELIPSAERGRFVSSGTEAVLMALRLARAYTGKSKLVRFRGHFHGWSDHVAFGASDHFDGSPSPGVVAALADEVLLLDPNDADGLRALIDEHDDIAAIILEPTGSTFGQVPIQPSFLSTLRELSSAAGIVLIFDEVVSGFRVSPGGAQAHYKVTPDLTTLAKILAGGLPGGAVVGRKDILDLLDHDACAASGRERILHPGTFNANPLSAAAGCAVLEVVRDTDACDRASAYAAKLRGELNQLFTEMGVRWAAYGTFSGFHVFTNTMKLDIEPASFDPSRHDFRTLKGHRGSPLGTKLRLAMRVNGVDISGWPGGPTCAAHNGRDLDHTVDAFRRSIVMLKEEGEITD